MRYAFTRSGHLIGPTESQEQSTDVVPPEPGIELWPRWDGTVWALSHLAWLERQGWLANVADRIAVLWAAADAWNTAGLDANDRAALLWATAPPVWARLSPATQADLQRWYAWGAQVWEQYWIGKARIQADLPFTPDFPPLPDRARITAVQAEIAGIAAALALASPEGGA